MFSRSAGYAVQALTYLAGQPHGKLTGAREIAGATGIPMPFLWKILRNLSQQKLLRSFKGVRGGYELARAAQRISIAEVLATTSDENLISACVLGLSQCNENDACGMHKSWQRVREQLDTMLRKTTLADLAREMPRAVRKRAPSQKRIRTDC
jgi:Rrf2 family transcriptional regulator, iron-sulfur cluster assembly transcription factor